MTRTTFTDDDKRQAALREARMRRRVYPRRVADGLMTEADAARGIAVMEAIAQDYRDPGLFGSRA